MALDHELQGAGKVVDMLLAVEGEQRLQQIRITALSAEVVIEDAFLQRRQRVDVLHIRHAARHGCHDLIDLRLGQVGQRQQVRGDVFAVLGNQVCGHHDFCATADRRCECSQRRLAEQHAHVRAQARLTHTPDQADRQQRMTAQLEEVVVSTDLGNAQQVLPDSRDLRFGFALWGFIATADQCINFGCWQSLAVQFAVRGQWQCIQQHISHRDHVGRQLFLQPAAQAVDVYRSMPCAQGVISHQTLVARHIFASSDHRFVDGRVFGQACIDLTELDTETADFHLIVVTAQVFDIAVRQIASQVAGAVHACRWLLAERVFEEAFGGQVVTVQVAPRHAGTADVDFTRDTQWNGLLLLVQQVKLRVANRFADVRSEALFAVHRHPA